MKKGSTRRETDTATLERRSDGGRHVIQLPHTVSGIDGYLDPPAQAGLAIEGIVVLCAESGFGKTYLTSLALHDLEQEGKNVRRIAFSDCDAEHACLRAMRVSRDVVSAPENQRPCLVLFDGIVPGDESQIAREVQAFERLVDVGVVVMVCLRPEDEQLVEALPHPFVLRHDDLRFRPMSPELPDWDLTGGIPQLVAALHADRKVGNDSPFGGERYSQALEELLPRVVVEGMTEEEYRVRLAAVLLGSGTRDELDVVSGRCDSEMLFYLQREATLFGVSDREGTFSCYGVRANQMLSRCLGVLQGLAKEEPDLVMRACGTLALRGDVLRSVAVCKLSSSERDFALMGSRWGVSYLLVGEVGVVKESLRCLRRMDLSGGMRPMLCSAALAELCGSAREVDKARAALATVEAKGEGDLRMLERVTLMGVCRDLCRDPHLAAQPIAVRHPDPVTSAALSHVRAFRLMLAGHFSETYVSLTGTSALREVTCIPEVLLCDDLTVSLVMSGGVPDANERMLSAQAEGVLARMGVGRMRSYGAALAQSLAILMGGGIEAGMVEDAATCAERMGDALLHAIFLIILAVRDLRVRGVARAHVRASKAAGVARTLGADYLASAAELVDGICLSLLGEHGALGRYCAVQDRPEELLMLGGLVAHAAGELGAESAYAMLPVGTPCPKDTLWALFLLMKDCGALSTALVRELPSPWLEWARAVRTRQADLFGHEEADEQRGWLGPIKELSQRSAALSRGTQGELLPARTSLQNVRISVFGSFAVSVNGESLAPELFDRRGARELVMLFAIAPGHRMQRFRAAELLWPDIDYGTEPRRMYEATSEARRRLMDAGAPRNPIVADRAQGAVGFDAELVWCDVDDFEREARLALEEDRDDFWVLDHARQMTRIYAGGLDPRVRLLGEGVRMRAHELEAMFVDATVAAAEAALRLGKGRMAVRYAMDAHRLGGLREDAMIVLVHALRVTGRAFEIGALYDAFCRRLAEEQGVGPSLALRQSVERAAGTDGEGATRPFR